MHEHDEIIGMGPGDAERKRNLEKAIREDAQRRGYEYESRVGNAGMDDLALRYRSCFLSWGKIMKSPARFSLQTLEAMMVLMSMIPARHHGGADFQSPVLRELDAEMCALRIKLTREIADRAAAQMESSGLSTGNPEGPKPSA